MHRHLFSLQKRLFSVSRITTPVSNVVSLLPFYSEALGLRLLPSSTSELTHFNNNGCYFDLRRVGFIKKVDETDEKALVYPYVTFAVSNMKTSARSAVKTGGQFEGDVKAKEPGLSVEGVFTDPQGRCYRVLHLFRRSPILSVTIGVKDMDASVHYYKEYLGFAEVDKETLDAISVSNIEGIEVRRVALAHPSAVLPTCLVLEESGKAAPICGVPVRAPTEDELDSCHILEIEVPSLKLSHEKLISHPSTYTSDFSHATEDSFLALDPDEYPLLIKQTAKSS